MSIATFPIELIATLAKFIHDDSVNLPTLQSFALVSRPWYIASQPYIFRAITLTTDTQLADLEKTFETRPSLGRYVRILTIRPAISGITSTRPWLERLVGPFADTLPTLYTAGSVSVPSPWLEQLVVNLPQMLPNLDEIRLMKLSEVGEHISEHFLQRFAAFTTVRFLSIKDSALDISLVFAFASALPSLRHLHVGSLAFLPLLVKNHAPRLTFEIHSLHLDMGEKYLTGPGEIIRGVLDSPSCHTLRVLKVVVNELNMNAVGQFIKRVGPQLKELDIEVNTQIPMQMEAEFIRLDITLETCRILETLTLRHHSPVSPLLMELLAEVPATSVRSLMLGTLGTQQESPLPSLVPLEEHLPLAFLDSLQEVWVLSRRMRSSDVMPALIADMSRSLGLREKVGLVYE